MRAVDVISKKRDGQALSPEEIQWFVDSYTKDILPDYQVAAFLMAICIRGMTPEETSALTMAMAHSGDILDLSEIADYVVDKHSSGGVGDKTSMAVLPLVAACGIPVAKMSGRGLGYTGGTLDKLESIAGFNVNLTEEQFYSQAKAIGLVIAGQTKDLAPADGKLYALRDVTGTVPSIPLIASSIMSKKIAAGANGIVLDVKTGSGAFMATISEAQVLATEMVQIGTSVNRKVIALISDMNQPLGEAVGHALEIEEAIATLRGEGPEDFRDHCLEIGAHMLRLAGQNQRWNTLEEAREDLAAQITNHAALGKFRQMVEAQGGDIRMVDDTNLLPKATIIEHVYAEETGYVEEVSANKVAIAAFDLGAGRVNKGDAIDLSVGVKIHVKVGNTIKQGDRIATIYANHGEKAESARNTLKQAVKYSTQAVRSLPLFYDVIGQD